MDADTVADAGQPAWQRFVDDPTEFAHASVTEMFSIPHDILDRIHLAGLQKRFADLRTTVPTLDRLATEQGIDAIGSFHDAVKLLFPHTFYKSYSYAHLEKGRYERLTAWLNELTSCDLSAVDHAGCQSLEDWMDRIEAASPVQCLTTSGTSGKMSFVPRTRDEWTHAVTGFFVRYFQGFDGEPNQDLCAEDFRSIPLFFPNFRHGRHTQHRVVDHMVDQLYGGDETMVMALYPGRMDLDVLSLAGRIQAAEAKGQRLNIPPALAARRDDFEAQRRAMPENVQAFFTQVIADHQGDRITTFCTWAQLYDAAIEARGRGQRQVFRGDSLILTGGGFKGRVLPDDWYDIVCDFIGMDEIRDGYGMSEQHFNSRRCAHNRYHCLPMNIPFLLDPDSGEMLPRTGTRTGRYAFYDLIANTYWGGFISGDEVTISWDSPCECGRIGPYFHRAIQRYSEKRGGDDKISCAGVPQAHARALDFIAGE